MPAKATQQRLADIFGFHRTAIVRWVREYRKDGKLEPRVRGHMAKAFSVEEKERLTAMVEDKPDLTLEEIREAFSKNRSLMAVHSELKRLGFRYKKTLKASGQEREDIAPISTLLRICGARSNNCCGAWNCEHMTHWTRASPTHLEQFALQIAVPRRAKPACAYLAARI